MPHGSGRGAGVRGLLWGYNPIAMDEAKKPDAARRPDPAARADLVHRVVDEQIRRLSGRLFRIGVESRYG
jgi:hypothetical protein